MNESSSPVKVGLCLLTWNELEGCRQDVPRLPCEIFDEVFAVDGGSQDGTAEYLEECDIPVYPQTKPGYNAAYIEAFSRTASDFLIMFHPKGSIDPSAVVTCRDLALKGYDLVIGSRNIAGAVNEEDSQLWRPRKWFVNGISLLTSLLFRRYGPHVWDVLHGFRGMRVDAFWKIEPLEKGLSIDLEMVARTYRLGLSRVEFPVTEKKRPVGTTHFTAFSTGKKLLAYLFHEWQRPLIRL